MTIPALEKGKNGTVELSRRLPVTASAAPVNAVAAEGTLTVATQPTAGDTMVIGYKTYTFVATGTAAKDGDINIGSDLATTQANIVDAILGNDDINFPNNHVTCDAAFATNDLTLTAINAGASGNSLATTETFTSGSNLFDADTLGTTTAGAGTLADKAGTMVVVGYVLYVCVADGEWRQVALSALS